MNVILLLHRLPLRVLLATLVVFLCVAIPLRRAYAANEEPVLPVERVEHVVLRLKGAEQAVEKRLLSAKLGLHFYGYLEGSYTQNFNSPSSGVNQLRIFDVNSNEARPNLAQFVLGREAQSDGNWSDRLGFKLKFNAGRDSAFIGGVNLNNWADFQEVYVQYLAPVGTGLNIQVGQINSLVGYEVIESPHNANYSRSWLFGLGQPFTTRGARVSYAFNKLVSVAVGAITYINSARADTQNDALVEYAIALAPSEKIKLTWYGLAGPRSGPSGTPGGTIFLTGGFVSVHISDRMSAVIESYYANQTHSSTISPGKNARWDGVAAYLIHDVARDWSVRLRAEMFEDPGGMVTCQGTTEYQPRANVCFGATSTSAAPPIAQTLWEVTSTLQYKPFKSVTTRVEYRYDKSNQNVFQIGGRPASYQPTLSFEAIYSF